MILDVDAALCFTKMTPVKRHKANAAVVPLACTWIVKSITPLYIGQQLSTIYSILQTV